MTSTKECLSRITELEAELSSLKEELSLPPLPEMVKIPNRPYSLGKYPVTVAEYKVFIQSTNPSTLSSITGEDNEPIVNITRESAIAYCEWLSEQTDQTFRLPTEDEWEYSCADHQKATPTTAVYSQDQIASVGTKEPNKFGLYDMLGNVWEMTSSEY